jgi:hexosaminidase
LQALEGTFQLSPQTQFYIQDTLQQASEEFMDKVVTATGFSFSINSLGSQTPSEGIVIKLSDQVKEQEGYELRVDPDLVVLEAQTHAGVYRGLQTLTQLLPAAIVADEESPIDWLIPAVEIKDYPLYEYRAAMLDVARHFF